MYRGYLALATGGKHITNVWADVVKVGDEFSYEKGSAPKLTHKIPLRKRGDESGKASPDNVLGAYCCAEIAGSNHVHITWASIDDLLAIADKSEAYSPKPRKGEDGKAYTPKPSGPWVDFFGEMCIKSVIRRAYKTWPLPDTAEYEPLRKAVEVDTQAEIMESAIDVESQEVEGLSSEDQKKIDDAIVAAGIKPEKVEAFLANIICKSYGIETIADLRPDLVAEVIKRIADYGAKLKAKAS
jgi:recombination protein RecT